MAVTKPIPQQDPNHVWERHVPKHRYVMAGTYQEVEYDGKAFKECAQCGLRSDLEDVPVGPCGPRGASHS